MRWKNLLLVIGTILIGSLGLSLTAHASPYIHDQLGILSAQQRQQIIQTNQQWQRTRNRPQLWVYTYAKLPDSALLGFDYSNPFDTPGNDLVDQRFQQLGQRAVDPTASTGDQEYAAAQATKRLHDKVSVIIVYPDNGWHTVIDPSDNLTSGISDFQKWTLTRRLPTKQGTAQSAMTFFNRYQKFITKHIAKPAKIKPGLSWAWVSFWICSPLLLWILIKVLKALRHPTFADDPHAGADMLSGYLWGRWMGGDHDPWDHF